MVYRIQDTQGFTVDTVDARQTREIDALIESMTTVEQATFNDRMSIVRAAPHAANGIARDCAAAAYVHWGSRRNVVSEWVSVGDSTLRGNVMAEAEREKDRARCARDHRAAMAALAVWWAAAWEHTCPEVAAAAAAHFADMVSPGVGRTERFRAMVSDAARA